MKKRRIRELDALKGVALIGIFLLHVQCNIEWAAFGVCIFFVLSGFLLETRYVNDSQALWGGVHFSIDFAVKHIRRAYLLHIITMLAAFILKVRQVGITMGILRDIVLNIFLLQSWWPSTSVNVSLNGVAWYLSTALFLYFMFPFIHKWLEKKESFRTLLVIGGSILAAQVLISWIALQIDPKDSFYRWATYDAPCFRIGDFAIGCILGKLVCNKPSHSLKQSTCNILITILIAATVGFIIWDTHMPHVSVLEKILNNWTTVYIPIVCLWVFLFATGQGFLPKIIVNGVTVWIGENSMYLFLIHYVVIKYAREIAGWFGEETISLLIAGIIAIITVLISLLYKKLILYISELRTCFITRRGR